MIRIARLVSGISSCWPKPMLNEVRGNEQRAEPAAFGRAAVMSVRSDSDR